MLWRQPLYEIDALRVLLQGRVRADQLQNPAFDVDVSDICASAVVLDNVANTLRQQIHNVRNIFGLAPI